MTKIELLEQARQELKKEYVGLDSIIDQVITAVTPWYITREIIQRPVVISLWGMTGTGKTSLIRRLIEILDLHKKTLFFDCGKEIGDGSSSISEKISDFFRIEDIEGPISDLVEDLVFVFDEFQYARTISEDGMEVDKPTIRPIWNLMDHGILNVTENCYDFSYFLNFTEDFLAYASNHQTVRLTKGKICDPNDVKELLDHLGFFYYSNRDTSNAYILGDTRDKDEEEDPYRKIDVIERNVLRIMISRLKSLENRQALDYINEINSFNTVGELAEFLKKARSIFTTPRYIECNKSLIFILGNLDEAFYSSTCLSADIDADIFYNETSNVSITDIKQALLNRFRPEQIARIGNNIIKYPSVRKHDFKKIIKKDINVCCNKFKESTGINIIPTDNLLDLIYSEGVFPTQGVRPLFTTIGTLFTPIFSDIISEKMSGDIIVDIKDPESGYNLDKKTIIYGEKEKEVLLELGKLRNPENRKLRYAISVHESGHAIIMAYLTGVLPSYIMSVDSDKGGFTVISNKNTIGETKSKRDIENDVKISLGGYYAEKVIFEDDGRILLGSENDIEKAWEGFSNAIYSLGFINPISYSNYESSNVNKIPMGFSDKEITKIGRDMFDRWCFEVETILTSNKPLILKMTKELSISGNMTESRFRELIMNNEGEGTLTEERLSVAKSLNDYDFYKQRVNSLLNKI